MGLTITSPADKCVICGKFRRAHSIASFCPTGKAGKGGVYTSFLDTKFSKGQVESAITKHKIKIGQVFLDAKGANHGLLVKDLHPSPTGDFVTAQKVTPLGKDGPLVRVNARVMAEVTHYEAEAPEWWVVALKPRGKK